MKYYKIVDPKGHFGLVYHEGYNEDFLKWNPNWEQGGIYEVGGIYFAREDILAFLPYGSKIYEVEPVGEIYEEVGPPKRFKAHAVNLKYVGEVNAQTVQILIDNSADVHADDDAALYYSCRFGATEIVYVLLANGANVHMSMCPLLVLRDKGRSQRDEL